VGFTELPLVGGYSSIWSSINIISKSISAVPAAPVKVTFGTVTFYMAVVPAYWLLVKLRIVLSFVIVQ
jgi:hypothetical protein